MLVKNSGPNFNYRSQDGAFLNFYLHSCGRMQEENGVQHSDALNAYLKAVVRKEDNLLKKTEKFNQKIQRDHRNCL
jgi:hypothetical protein